MSLNVIKARHNLNDGSMFSTMERHNENMAFLLRTVADPDQLIQQ